MIWLFFFLFFQTKASFSPLFAWSQLDISAVSDSVLAVSEGYQLNYCWILKLLSGTRIFELIICIQTAEFGMISAEPACWDIERK
jgi:hypothetical protein